MNNITDNYELDVARLFTRILNQKPTAFFCVTTSSVSSQREMAENLSGCFSPREVQVIDFAEIGNDFRFSGAALCDLANEGVRTLLLANFHLVGGGLVDSEFFQTLNLCRDSLAELPYVFVFMMPVYFRTKIARNAPDFYSILQHQADSATAEEPVNSADTTAGEYNNEQIELLEDHIEKYSRLECYESKQAFELLLSILVLNKYLRVLRNNELNRFYSMFTKLLPKYEGELYDGTFFCYSSNL
jgi:hypothetical protein